jgi:molybdate transport system substrate-binding protein
MTEHSRLARFGLVCVAAVLAAALAAGCGSKAPDRPSAEVLGGQVDDVASSAFEAAASGLTGDLLIHVPCGMIIPVKKAITVFRQSNPDLAVEEDYDNAAVLVTKIIDQGVKPDVFMSPGISEIARLEEKGLIDPDSKVALGSFELVIITNRDSGVEINSPEDLLKCDTISIPEPGVNSVGTSGREALENLGLWDDLEPKLLTTDQAIKSHNYVVEGKVDAGISYRACPLETNPDKMDESRVRIACPFPEVSYEKQKIWVAPLKDSANPEAARALIEFLGSPEGLTVLAENDLPGAKDLIDGAGASQEVAASSASAIMGETGIGSIGPEDAPVQVVAYFPDNDTHVGTWEFIHGLSERYGDKIHLEMVDFESDAGFDRWLEDGFTCGAITVNGKTHWVFEKDGEPAEAVFRQKMGQDWFQEDLIAVLDMLTSEGAGQ